MSKESGRLAGEVVLVTGANRGIGEAIAKLAGQEGAFVGAAARSKDDLEGIETMFREYSIEGQAVQLDVTCAETFEDRQAKIVKAAGNVPVSVLINSAGITRDGIIMRLTEEEIRDVIETNLIGPLLLSKSVMKGMMKARKGNILNISSVVGIHGEFGQSSYAGSKGGLNAVSLSLARELPSRGIKVNALGLGLVDTRMTHDLPEEARETMLNKIPLGRAMTPDEAARAAIDTVASGYNQEIVIADGGYTKSTGKFPAYKYWDIETGFED